MTTDQILFFLTLAKCQHLTYAADQLHISQPALSHSLQRLEEELGSPLFDRIGRGIKLNKSGEIFLEYCKNMMDNYESAKAEIKQLRNDISSTVNIFWNQKFSLDNLLIEFLEKNPDIQLNLVRKSMEEIDEGLLTGECDFGITLCLKEQWSRYSYISLPSPCWYIALSSQNPLAKKGTPPRLSDLQDMKFVCLALDDKHTALTKRLCKRAGYDADVVFQTTPRICLDMVAEKDWAFLSPSDDFILASGNTYYKELVSFSPLSLDDFDSTQRILFNKSRSFTKSARRFFDFMYSTEGATLITTPDFELPHI